LHVLLYFSVFKLVLVIYPIKFILKMTNNIRDITSIIYVEFFTGQLENLGSVTQQFGS
jgi:hypothetical protein